VSSEQLSYQDLVQLIDVIKSTSDFTDFHLKMGEVEIELHRGGSPARNGAAGAPAMAPAAAQTGGAPASLPAGSAPAPVQAPATVPAAAAPVPAASPTAPAAARSYPENAILIKSPMVGTFYRAPEPGAPPFAEVGQRVEAGATVCIIEVMKLMNSLCAEQAGTVVDILAEDGMPVEFGQVLLVLQP